MDSREVQISVSEIKKGDRYGTEAVGWTALEDATTSPSGGVALAVEYADGGNGWRNWVNGSREVVVSRG